jgi:ketosteroid isomerase-like protein
MSYFADDAAAFPAGKPLLSGRENLRENYSRMFKLPEFSLTWRPVKADAAESGDIGYSIGTSEFKYRDKEGKIVAEHGKYLTVWKKQKDGSWKVVADLGN